MNTDTKILIVTLVGIAFMASLVFSGPACARGITNEQTVDIRYCGKPERWANGKIKRSQALARKFKRMYPLPPQYNEKEWQVDHVIPLKSGGCDSIENLQRLPKVTKTCGEWYCKDRYERKIYPKNY